MCWWKCWCKCSAISEEGLQQFQEVLCGPQICEHPLRFYNILSCSGLSRIRCSAMGLGVFIVWRCPALCVIVR